MSYAIDKITKFVTYMNKPDTMGPVIGLEATVTGGRTIQAQKRGGKHEARERLIEESTGAIVWLGGVKLLNKLGDWGLEKLFGGNFDVGTDKILRTPFDNFTKDHPNTKYSPKSMALIKATKVLLAVAIADAFIGLIVPPLNQKLTRKIAHKDHILKQQDRFEANSDKAKTDNVNFKAGRALSAINVFTNAIENTNTGKLLSTDVGLTSGRIYSARNNDERREIAIRDIGSVYFYMWAQNHIGNLLNFVETGKFSRLNPSSAVTTNEHLINFIKSKGGELSVEEFKNLVLGKKSSEITLPEGINFETSEISEFSKFMNKFKKVKTEPLQVAKVSELESLFDETIFERIKAMSQLQPLRQGEAVITKQQIIDAINIAEINNPEFLNNIFDKFTGGGTKGFGKNKKIVKGSYNDPYKYVSNSKLYNLKKQIEDYINNICNSSKDGKINEKLLNKIKNKNLIMNSINFITGFTVAAIFLSTLIPKFQYWYTKMRTGKNEFPGTYGLENS